MAYIVENDIIVAALTKQLEGLQGNLRIPSTFTFSHLADVLIQSDLQ